SRSNRSRPYDGRPSAIRGERIELMARDIVGVVGVVGAGTMGAGIAQLALEAGHEVVLHDVDEAAIERGRERIRDGLARRAARLELDPDTIDDWVDGRLAGLRHAHTIDALAGEAGIAIEAAIEDLALKQTIFRALDAAAAAEVILATNTRARSGGAIAAATTHPERVLGLHFFNPAPVMPLVELVTTEATHPAVADRAEAIVAAWGKTVVRCSDAPGFIVNRVNRPFTIEALRILEAGEASIEEIDGSIRDAGYPMGPFELMDLTGIDVNLSAATGVWDRLGRPDRLRPSPIQESLVAAGRLGRKSGTGFYDYTDGRRGEPAADFATRRPAGVSRANVVARIGDAIAREAALAVEEGVATPEAVARALKLGAGHPRSPFDRTARPGP
ncbi:MAG TPA: 3-hydroxyacyl-CoA dehydrogenase NAD-binding domain-containing protein, partial [Candidatus Limnocylindrales bacterium]|nr:3-hydroxyacyl-CoA dehydrogenase NAD-binding domain-containing protein [Candidatus Limnocylindrales bacterium]